MLGKPRERPTTFNPDLVERVRAAIAGKVSVVVGKTLAASDFYEEQGRCDGAWRTHTRAQALQWLQHIHTLGAYPSCCVRAISTEGGFVCAHPGSMRAVCWCSPYRTCVVAGVRNIEMESSELAAFCNQAQVPAVMLAVAIVDRLQGDQVRGWCRWCMLLCLQAVVCACDPCMHAIRKRPTPRSLFGRTGQAVARRTGGVRGDCY